MSALAKTQPPRSLLANYGAIGFFDETLGREGDVRPHYVLSGRHFRREFVNFEVPRDIYIHVCGTDLIRNENGDYMVLEDNGRCPSGVNYVLENRRAMKRAFHGMFERIGVQPVDYYLATQAASATHAWTEVFVPGIGWQGLDPTHNFQPDETYVKISVGRDYADVAPVKGT